MDQNLEIFDLAIIGASLAGNYLAYLLSKTDLKVVVIEEHSEIGLPFQCAGIVSQKLAQLIDLPKEIVLNRVKIAKIVSPSGKYIQLSGEEQPYIVDRVALDKLFYEKIKDNKNITYFLGERFKHFEYFVEKKQKYVLIETSKRKLRVKMLIGCDGPLSLVAKSFGIKNRIIYGAQIRIKAHFNQNEAVMHFDPNWKELFGWIVPEGESNIFRVGLASAKKTNENFKTFLIRLNLEINQKIDQQGGIIPYGIMNKLAFDNALLVGDSAGQVKATTGGGIVMLLIAARFAAQCVQKCFKTTNFSKKFIKKHYEQKCSISIGKQIKLHFIVSQIFETFSGRDLETFFQIVKTSKVEQLISLYADMDFPKSLIIRLLKNSMVFKFLIQLIRKNPFIILKILRILFNKT